MSIKLSRVATVVLCLMFFSTLIGCDKGPKLSGVTGSVTLDGDPLVGAMVWFDSGNTRPASGMTDEQGNFVISLKPGTEGALVGTNTVRIYAATSDAEGNDLPESEIIPVPARYNEETELSVEVLEGENEPFNFELTSD